MDQIYHSITFLNKVYSFKNKFELRLTFNSSDYLIKKNVVHFYNCTKRSYSFKKMITFRPGRWCKS
jgi:hypothetical protein